MKLKAKRPQKQGTTMDYYIRGRYCYVSRYKATDWQVKMKDAKYHYTLWSGEGNLIYETYDDLEKIIEAMQIYDDYRHGTTWVNLATFEEGE